MAESARIYLKLVLVSAFWGGTFIAGRVAAQTMDPIMIAFLRFLVASILLGGYLSTRKPGWVALRPGQLSGVVAAGLMGIATYNLFFFNGLRLIEANRASLIVALNPVAIMTGGALLGVERFTRQRVAGLLLALAGVAVVLTGGNFSNLQTTVGRGELLVLGCVFSWVMYTLVGRSLVQELSPLVVTTYSSIAGCAALALAAVVRSSAIAGLDLPAFIAILFLGVFGTTLAFVWYYQGVKSLGPTSAGVFINLVPAWGVALSALLLGERIPIASLVGGLGIVAGVFLTNRQSEQGARASNTGSNSTPPR